MHFKTKVAALTLLAVLLFSQVCFATDAGYADRKNQRQAAYEQALENESKAKSKYLIYYNKSDSPKEINAAYNEWVEAAKHVENKRRALAPFFEIWSADEDVSDARYSTTSLPAEVYLYCDPDYMDGADWYIWDTERKAWNHFSNELYPTLTLWRTGWNSIKLVKNWDPANYIIRDVYVSVTEFLATNPKNGKDLHYNAIPGGQIPYIIQLTDASIDAKSWSWYAWDVEKGRWAWFSNQQNPQYKVWKKGLTSIKLVKDNLAYDYVVNYVYMDEVDFQIYTKPSINVTDKTTVSVSAPGRVELVPKETLEKINGLDWYLWDKEKGSWVWFSNERKPVCQLWQLGVNSIKMVKNWDTDNFVVHNVTTSW